DLGINQDTDFAAIWQTSDEFGNTDMLDFALDSNLQKIDINEKIGSVNTETNGYYNSGDNIVIDGYFGDWTDVNKFSDDNTVENLNIDLNQYARQIYGDDTYYYLNVEGKILNGIEIPAEVARQVPSASVGVEPAYTPSADTGNQESTPLPVDLSEDAIRIFVDTDGDDSTGYKTIGMSIGADEMIEIKGVYGIITKRVSCSFDSLNQGAWEWTSCEIIEAAASGNELELAAQIRGNYFIHLTSWDLYKDSNLADAYFPIGARNPYNTIAIDNTDDWDSDEETTVDSIKWFMTWDATNLYFGTNADMDGSSASDKNALAIFIDMNPGTNDGETSTHYNIDWNIGDTYKYDYIAMLGKIDGMGGDGIGIKIADCTGTCSWTENKEEHSDWNMSLGWDGSDLSEMKVPRDWDDSGSIDSDEFPLSQDDSACFTFAMVNTNNNYVWATNPNLDSGGEVTFTKCIKWNEMNADINDVWAEGTGIPEFSSIVMPILSVIGIIGLSYRNRKKS
ncbi:MAG: hypothetical protein CMC79_05970, partial [Flavobacteriaceae bacterium]|nr:hypothetical protein [Flavobacteriaceae bacterium]